MNVQSSFEKWIHPLSLEKFEKKYLHQKIFHGCAVEARPFFTWETLNALLNQTSIWSPTTLSLYAHGRPISPQAYCSAELDERGQSILRPSPSLVQTLISQGASLTLNDISELTPCLKSLGGTLRSLFGARVQANLYASWPGVQAFASHFDVHDVFVFQAEGEKTWNIYKNRVEAPVNHPKFNLLTHEHHEAAKGDLLQKLTLKAGDFLYLPRGFYHDALASTQPSLHITFGVTRPVGLDVISLLFEKGFDYPLWRHYLTPSSLQEQCQALGNHLQHLMSDPDFLEKVRGLFNQKPLESSYTLPGES